MHCMYCGMAKGISQAEATFNSKPVALAIVKLLEFESAVSRSVGWLVGRLVGW